MSASAEATEWAACRRVDVRTKQERRSAIASAEVTGMRSVPSPPPPAAAGRAPIGPRADVDVLVERVLELPDHRLRQALPLLQDHPLPPHIHVSSVSHEQKWLKLIFLNWLLTNLIASSNFSVFPFFPCVQCASSCFSGRP